MDVWMVVEALQPYLIIFSIFSSCFIFIYLQTVSVTVSVLTLTFISIDRWYAICFPLRYVSTNQRAIGSIAFIWMVALLSGNDNRNLYYFLSWYIYYYYLVPKYMSFLVLCVYFSSVFSYYLLFPSYFYIYYLSRSSVNCFSRLANFHFSIFRQFQHPF